MYSFDSRIRYSECDERSVLSLPSLIDYFQDCSTFHSEEIGHGVGHLASHHFAWVITSWQIRVNRMPRFLDRVRISTWCYEMGAVSARRNFQITSEEGASLVEADSMWVVFDTDRRRAVRIPQSEQAFVSDDEPLDFARGRRRLTPAGVGVAAEPIVVTRQHLDTNHHVNNGRYVEMAYEVAIGHDDAFEPHLIEVQYRNAAYEGDVIFPVLYEEADALTVDLADEDGARFAICRMAGATRPRRASP